MKLHRLELEGFGPFRDRQFVDFDAFDDDGIFLITGRTGAGKSSILDGVCFALFGSAPRYDGGEKRLRSDHSTPDEPTEVSLEFSTAGSRWRVTRSPEYDRPKARGEGLTPVAHAARLEKLVGDSWVGQAAKPREVAHLLDEILGLNQQQFLQVILLAQNRFAQFLLAKNDDRQALLRTLFGSRTYEDYQHTLDQRRKDAEQRLARGGDVVALLLAEAERLARENALIADESGDDESGDDEATSIPSADTVARLADGELTVQRAGYRAETLERERAAASEAQTAAEASFARLSAVHDKQRERERSRIALAGIEQRAPAVAVERSRLERAVAAEALRATIETAHRADVTVELSAVTRARAAADWAAAGEPDAADASALRARIDELTGQLGVWKAALVHERALEEFAARMDAERARVDDLDGLLAELDERRAALPGRRAALEAELAPLFGAEVAVDAARERRTVAEARLAAAREAEQRADAMRTAESGHAECLVALERCTAAVTALLQRRLAGHAGELAAALVDGEPCAVCGATEHPRPAAPSDEPVTEAVIAEAERVKDAAADAERLASGRARESRAAHAEAAARAGGENVAALEEIVTGARGDLDLARAAAARLEVLVAERAALTEAEAAAAAEHQALTAACAEARETLALTTQATVAAQAEVDAARGDFDTVAARRDDAKRRRDLARALADAIAAHTARDEAAREAAEDLATRVAASVFADASDAFGALLDTGDRTVLDAGIREHEIALRSERDRLLALTLELAGEADEPIDLAAAQVDVATARTISGAAAQTAIAAAHVSERLRSLVSRAQEAHAGTAEFAAEHALIAGLANAVAGRNPSRMDLETFVLAAELEEIVSAANLRLDEMSSGRYRLQHTDAVAARNAASGLGLAIIDAYTGQARPPQSLSGGETFLASLALALGLAEVVTARAGGIRLDTLFIDEGFGSLDSETLEIAMRTLDELRQGGRTVGVISHVGAMKDRLTAQLTVTATMQGWSTVHQVGAAVPTA